jgi:predicted RNase H-like HicB family nuclease
VRDYLVQIYWDNRAGYYVAEIPDIPTCSADAPTRVLALKRLEDTFHLLAAEYRRKECKLPKPRPRQP